VSRPALIMVDDAVARTWRPFTLTRPAGELLFGTRTLRARAEEATGSTCMGHIASAELLAFDEPWAPPVLALADQDRTGDVVYLLSRFAADPTSLPDGPALLVSSGRVVGLRLSTGDDPPDPAFFHDPDAHAPDLPTHEVPGQLLHNVWDLMAGNAERVSRDLSPVADARTPDGVHRLGDGAISLGRDVRLAPGVVLDTSAGPIRLDDGVDVRPYTSLVGPAYVGPGCSLLGGSITAVSLGPRCKVHGEMEETVFLGYSNKAHDGFLGHAYVGMWVNLGALTTNSDLKNNYGVVRVWTPDGEADTGLTKVGCFLGDHVKTAIGTMINTGTVVEAGANVFGGMPPKYVPPFRWGADAVYEAEPFLETARTVMSRRDVDLSDRQRAMLEAIARSAGSAP
jgi:UDP-N-acetylglucosamine diphosphorylase / glucose-1-phosphate thymidylyltransferase / UDP-N-acetylgalactosamine diphosphorylase / glucosamine-1-phosphate N-acetyltransferase / galactosamine-1-phosphate N-acetyltransferase